jgi:Holliday junction DNA helicase RuvA
VLSIAGIGVKVFVSGSVLEGHTTKGSQVRLSTYMHIRDGAVDMYGFSDEHERHFFESLISVSGVGPKSAMNILSMASLDRLLAAVSEGDAALFQKTAGIGKKTAERIVLELKEKVIGPKDEHTIAKIKADSDVLEALVGLGYQKAQARAVIGKIDDSLTTTDDRLRDALKKIKKA